MQPLHQLLAMLLVPLAGAAALAVAPARLAKHIATGAASLVFLLAVLFAWQFPEWTSGGFAPELSAGSLGLGVAFTLGVDSVSLLLILMTAFLTPLALLASYASITHREREFYGWFLVLLSSMLLAFMARDAIAFYVGYEFTIVPMLFLIGIFGGDERRYASVKFFVYTFVASIITFAGIVYVAAMRAEAVGEWTFSLPLLEEFARTGLSENARFWVFVALMTGFCVKVPFFPVHTWLPLAHNQAPTAGSVILAGTLLKLGTYGIYRIALPMAPDATVASAGVLAILALVAIVAISLVCLAQQDVKRLVAYSSVSHMGVCMLGLFALNPAGVSGAILYMLNHGLSTGALFLCIGMFYERYHTKDMREVGGLARRMPVWAFFMILFTMSSIGLPGLNGFVSEFLCLFGAFTANADGAGSGYPGVLGPRWMLLAGVGSLILGAVYMLYMVGRVVWGPLREPHGGSGHGHAGGHDGHPVSDLNAREIGVLAPIALVCVLIGVQPWPLLDAIEPAAKRTIALMPQAVRDHQAETGAGTGLATTISATGEEPGRRPDLPLELP